jgi:hypothetical protein
VANILLGHNNRIDGAVLSGGSWGATLDNLKNPDPDVRALSSNALNASTRFAMDLGAVYPLRVLALVNHNMLDGVTWRVRAASAAIAPGDAGDLLDTGLMNARQMTFRTMSTPVDWGTQHMVFTAFNVNARYLTVEVFSGASVGIGRVFVGSGFQPTHNAEYGLKDSRTDLSFKTRGVAGKQYFREISRRPREVAFNLPFLSNAEGEYMHELQGTHGKTSEILYVPDPADLAHSQRFGFLGRFVDLDPLDTPLRAHRGLGIALEEKL